MSFIELKASTHLVSSVFKVMGNSIGDSKIEDKPSLGAKVQSSLKQEVLFHYYECGQVEFY